jgi:hypothetical protein
VEQAARALAQACVGASLAPAHAAAVALVVSPAVMEKAQAAAEAAVPQLHGKQLPTAEELFSVYLPQVMLALRQRDSLTAVAQLRQLQRDTEWCPPYWGYLESTWLGENALMRRSDITDEHLHDLHVTGSLPVPAYLCGEWLLACCRCCRLRARGAVCLTPACHAHVWHRWVRVWWSGCGVCAHPGVTPRVPPMPSSQAPPPPLQI